MRSAWPLYALLTLAFYPESDLVAETKQAEKPPVLWSTQALEAVAIPALEPSPWDRNPIDTFIRARHQSAAITASPEADERTLFRRLHLDLLGLPPSPIDLALYLSSTESNRFDQWADRLLSSPAYGERWGRHWLDVARFAESSGFEHDSDRPTAYPYRDFVIRALNQNLPYDTFVQWQIAGDRLAPERATANAATGFLGAGVFPTQLTEKEFESARYDELDDMVSTIGSAILGLSVGCARCHDHKFDPIPATDYYALAATFTETIRSEVELTTDLGRKLTALVNTEGKPPIKHAADGRGFPHFYKTTFFLKRGDTTKKGPAVSPGFLSLLERDQDSMALPSGTRVDLAHWLTDERRGAGHLVARVIVNRLWQHHFGTGLVSTPNDFGTQGTQPSHPKLLDWLAYELIQRDWNIKAIQRLMVTSATYRQATHHNPASVAVDPGNRLLWRFSPRRLEAEAIRDSMLAVSGLLDSTAHGAGTLDPDMPRRSIYFFVKRSKLVPLMLLFDFPEPLVSIGRRATTNIAPQGLTLMNSPIIRRYALGLAERAIATGPSRQIESVIQSMFELAYNRPPSEKEAQQSRDFIMTQQGHLTKAALHESAADLAQSLFMSNEFLYLR